MIIMRLHQGLGNQLFQYACGRSLSLERGVPLRFDESFFHYANAKRKLWLKHFAIAGEMLPLVERQRGEEEYGSILPAGTVHYVESCCGFHPEFYDLPIKNMFLSGYFQSEKYFKHNADVIREDLAFVDLPHDESSRKLEAQIREVNAVSLHVRRTDYVGNQCYDILSDLYYERAKKCIRESTDTTTFFVFSDDVEFCRQYMSSADTVIATQRENPVVDLYLMSLCNHHIISNSTFAWWGAWLGANPNKIVIAPNQWYYPEQAMPIDDVIPEHWIRIDI